MSQGRGLVFGGGGVAGIAWETGVIAGLSDAPGGISAAQLVDGADVIIGTSAGAVVAAQLATGCDIDELYAAQLAGSVVEIEPVPGQVVDARTRRAVIAARLPNHEWPQRKSLKITAVNLATGQPAVFDRASGVPLVVAPLAGDASLREAAAQELQLLPDCAALVVSAEPAPLWDNSLSPDGREPAARAGRALGRAKADEVAHLWG
jgi:NTE family protein